MKTIIVSYSLRHYTPGIPIREGIGNVAKILHEAVLSAFPKHRVIYTDPTNFENLVDFGEVEWLFTVPRELKRAKSKFRPKFTVLFTANESSQSRFNIVGYAKKHNIKRNLIGGHDGIYEDYRENIADYIVALGGWNTYSSFLRRGISQDKVITTGIRYQNKQKSENQYKPGNYIVWFMGLICIRKGINELPKILKAIDNSKASKKLRLIGFTESQAMRSYIENAFNNADSGHQWIDKKIYFGSSEWEQISENVHFGIFPSREEGLPGCVIDLVNEHIPVVYSSRCGLDFVTKELSEVDFLSDSWIERLPAFLEYGKKEWEEIAQLQSKVAFFALDNNQIELIVKRLSEGRLWPVTSTKKDESCDYIFSRSLASDLDLIVNYRGPYLSDELVSRLLILELERYSNFRSAGFVAFGEIGHDRIKSIHKAGYLSHDNPQNITLYVVDEEKTINKYSISSRVRKACHFHQYDFLHRARKFLKYG